MAFDICYLEARYLNSCKRQEVPPNSSILSGFNKAKLQKSHQELCCLEIFLDHLKDADFPLLLDIFAAIISSEIDAVDILHESHLHESHSVLFNGESVVSLIRAVGQKLRIVDLQDLPLGKDFLLDLFQRGLTCQVLNLRSPHIRKLDMTGAFMQLHTLNLDVIGSLTSFREGCFSCMPNLMRLSMCETGISNLWTTTAALSKLPSLVELRFQNCLCRNDTGPCQASSGRKAYSSASGKIDSGQLQLYPCAQPASISSGDYLLRNYQDSDVDDMINDVLLDDESFVNHELLQNTSEESSDDSELDFSGDQRGLSNWVERLANGPQDLPRETLVENSVNMDNPAISFGGSSPGPVPFQSSEDIVHSKSNKTRLKHETHQMGIFDDLRVNLKGHANLDEFYSNSLSSINDTESYKASGFLDLGPTGPTDVTKQCLPHYPSPICPSPICYEKHYREYLIASLPRLKVLDNLPVENEDRKVAKMIVSQYYEYLPYNRRYKESIVNILQRREIGTSTGLRKSPKMQKMPYFSEMSQYSFTRSISAAKVGSSAWPSLHRLSKIRSIPKEETKSFRPRQFEYHPCNPSLMVFGTLDGELVIINHESGKLVSFLPSVGAMHSVLGLCWLKKHPSKLIAGSDNGSLQLYDIRQMPSAFTDRYCCTDAATFSFDEFEQLTSVHVNSTDERLLVSGYSKHVALYDIGSGRRIQAFKNLHQEHINVVKFAHHYPSIFATSSFDQEVKMWDLRQGPSRPCFTASSSRGNVMVCFSPDDHYLLSSAVDNEVKQLLAVDGRLHMKFNIAPTGSAQNYTRSYYMNGGDYIISGSCEEKIVRICCAQTGRRLRDISLEGRGSRNSMFVQSLRGDPYRDFHMSVLAAYPSSKSEIIKINLLAAGDNADNSYCQSLHPSQGMGG
eukprot:TRINITY_DN4714_c0_g1_i2.p1 TRINITY_DN4714_c0_g1~~TRINITY_DN4714_c0_g1_i2.p1  ORF type:complete len:924 (-),score=163.06 TRINITY_DN4714_c0_g1_i2:262-2976(-)